MSWLLSHYATNRDQLGFYRQVITRHSCHSPGNLALLCLGRAATRAVTVQPTDLLPHKKPFRFFSVLSPVFRECPPNHAVYQGSEESIVQRADGQVRRLERTTISTFFLDRATRASRGLTVRCCDRSWPPRKCKVCLVSSWCRFRIQLPIYPNRDLPEMFTETCSFKHCCMQFYTFTVDYRCFYGAKLRSRPSAVHAERFSFHLLGSQAKFYPRLRTRLVWIMKTCSQTDRRSFVHPCQHHPQSLRSFG